MTESEEHIEEPEANNETTDETEPPKRYVNVPIGSAQARKPRRKTLPTIHKVIILLAIPALTALGIFSIIKFRSKHVVEYKTELLTVGEKFVKHLAADNIRDAYDMLMPIVWERTAAETVEADYVQAAAKLGKYVSMTLPPDWGKAPKGEAPTSYTARFKYEKGVVEAELRFVRVRVGDKNAPLEYRISKYSFKSVAPD